MSEHGTAPIRFICATCGYRARIPATYAGKVIHCPSCQTVQVVQVESGQATGGTVHLARVETLPTVSVPEADGRIRWTCPACAFSARLAGTYAGKAIACPSCSSPQVVPPQAPAPTAQPASRQRPLAAPLPTASVPPASPAPAPPAERNDAQLFDDALSPIVDSAELRFDRDQLEALAPAPPSVRRPAAGPVGSPVRPDTATQAADAARKAGPPAGPVTRSSPSPGARDWAESLPRPSPAAGSAETEVGRIAPPPPAVQTAAGPLPAPRPTGSGPMARRHEPHADGTRAPRRSTAVPTTAPTASARTPAPPASGAAQRTSGPRPVRLGRFGQPRDDEEAGSGAETSAETAAEAAPRGRVPATVAWVARRIALLSAAARRLWAAHGGGLAQRGLDPVRLALMGAVALPLVVGEIMLLHSWAGRGRQVQDLSAQLEEARRVGSSARDAQAAVQFSLAQSVADLARTRAERDRLASALDDARHQCASLEERAQQAVAAEGAAYDSRKRAEADLDAARESLRRSDQQREDDDRARRVAEQAYAEEAQLRRQLAAKLADLTHAAHP